MHARPFFRSVLVVLTVVFAACAPADKAEATAAPEKKQQAVLSPILSQGFESGLGTWTAATTSGVATWHVLTHPETISVASTLNPLCVTLADTGAHLSAAGGTKVAWFGNDNTGTFIGSGFPAQTANNGGTSAAIQTGTLTSPSVSLVGAVKAQLEFDSWWEVEGVSSTAYDLVQVWVSVDGAAFALLGQLNPRFAAAQPPHAAYSSGGPAAAPIWRHYSFDLSAYAGTTNLKVQFRFDSKDTSYNAFRGFTVDNVLIAGGPALNGPTLTSVSPSVATQNDFVTISGSNFIQGATFFIGTTQIGAASITQFGANEMIFKAPSLTAGTYSIKVTNPDGQSFTLPNAFTYSSTTSPTVVTVAPATANVGATQGVTITGTNFIAGSSVSFGDSLATNVVVASATSLTATAPALSSGTWNVTVSNPSGQSGTKFAAYTVSDTSTMAITSPTGASSWTAGSTQNITWTSSGASVISADLYKGTVFVANIAASVPAVPGTYAWSIPAVTAAGSDYKVKLFNPLGTVSTTSANFSITAAAVATTTSVVSSVSPSAAGQAVTFTATVSPAATGGTVQFKVDGVDFGPPVALSGSAATSTATSSLSGGAHTVLATYSGSSPFGGSAGSSTHQVNRSPTASAQAFSTPENTSRGFTLGASDPDGDALTFTIVSGPAHGTLSGAAPNFTYSPTANYFGPDAITFKANDGRVDSNTASVTITVTKVNVAPTASNQSKSTAEDNSVPVTLIAADANGDALTWSIVSGPAHGTLSGTAPNLTYQPAADFHGVDAFTFRVSDGSLDSNLATVSLTVTSVNDAPVAAGQTLSVMEDGALPITLLGMDVDGDTLAYQVVTGPAHGSLSGIAPNLTYRPAADYAGADSFTFKVNDGALDSNVATITMSVTAVNDAPIAIAQSLSPTEDTAFALILGGSDVDGDSLSFIVVSAPQHGTLSGAPPNLTYSPAANYAGPDSFTFKANDGALDSAPATISLTVIGVNDAPQATAQSVTTDEDQVIAITVSGTDVEGDSLTFSLVSGPSHGTLTGTAPHYSYQPEADYAGPDAFSFKANDGAADSAPAQISITVSPVNDAPVAQAQSVSVNEDAAAQITVGGSDVDGDSLSFIVVSSPAHGTLSGSAPNFTYVPAADYFGPDSFTFKANDGALDSNVATVSISISSVNDAPLANSQSVETAEDISTSIALSGSDVEGDSLSFTILSGPAHGTLAGTAPNFTYQPAPDYFGADSFTFKVNDGAADSSLATVSLSISSVNDAPIALASSMSTEEDTSAAVVIAGSDVDGDALTWIVVTPPAHGTLTGNAPNFTYLPAADYFGPDSFSFKANDGALDSNVATVSISISSANDAPVALAQTLVTQEDVATAVTLSGTDVDGDPLTYTIVTPPAHGTLSGTAPNFTYLPAADYHGADSFTFEVSDGTASSSPVQVSLTVQPVNDAPVAHAQSVTTAKDTAAAITLSGTDVDGDSLSYTIVAAPAHGTLSGTAPQLSFEPTPGYHGSDSFSFKVGDGSLESEVAVVSITIDSVNDAPVANGQSITTAEDTLVAVLLTGTDDDGDTLTWEIVTAPQHGIVTGTPPQLTYVPNLDYHGPDSFSFIANDGVASSSPASVAVMVTSVNDAPVATSAAITLAEDGTAAVVLSGSDVDGDAITFVVVTPPAHGVLTGTAPNLTYAPAADYHGADQLSFIANDGALDSAPVTISLTITAVNDAPIAAALTIDAEEDEDTRITLTGSDVDVEPLTFTVETQPQHGTLTGTPPSLVYRAVANYVGPDSFTFHVSDAVSDSASAQVTIEVGPINDAPVAAAQALTGDEDSPLLITLSATDEEGAPLTYAVVRGPAHGQLSGTGAELRYLPAADFNGEDDFTFVANDGQVDSAVATVSLTIAPRNDAPIASPLARSTPEDEPVELTLSGTDVDGDSLTYVVTQSPAHGVLSGSGEHLLYSPAANFNGTDTFSFKVNDGTEDSADAVVTIQVGPRNDAPVAEAVTVAGTEDSALEVMLAASDLDGDALTYAVISGPAHGTLSGTAPRLSYQPEANYFGADSFTFKANDGAADSNVATVSITVASVDDRPTAEALSVSLAQSSATHLELRGNDTEAAALTFSIVTAPQHGTLTGEAPALVYKADPAYVGTDSFTYVVTADGADSDPAEVSITIHSANDSLSGGGLGCSSTGSSTPWVVLGLMMFLALARRRGTAVKASAVSLVLSVSAQAQTALPAIDVESLRLNPGASQSLVTETGTLMKPQTIRFAVTGHYQYEPLVLFRDGERIGALVKDRFTTIFGVAWAPLPWLEVAGQLPLVLAQRSDELGQFGYAQPASTALGTALLQARVGLLQQRSGAPIDLVISLGVDLPVGSLSALSREAGFGALPRLGVGRTLFPWLRVGAEAGVMLRPSANFRDDPLGRTAFQGAVLVETLGGPLRGELSWHAAVPMSGGAVGSELIAGGRFALTTNLELYALAGVGLGPGLGTPAFRAAAGLSLSLPFERPAPQRCRPGAENLPEECPLLDWDGDGVANAADRCPRESGPEAGCAAKPVAAAPAVVVVPEPAPVIEAVTVGPSAEEVTLNGLIAARLAGVKLFIGSSDQLNVAALPALRDVVALIKAHPEVTHLRVEAHTDPTGSAARNEALTIARAERVSGWLAGQGLAGRGIAATGFGGTRPLTTSDSKQGREVNQRVEIRVGAATP